MSDIDLTDARPKVPWSVPQLAVVAVILLIIGGVAGYLVADDSDRVGQLENELAVYQEAEAQAAAEAAERPRLRLLAVESGLSTAVEGGDDDVVSLNFRFGTTPQLEEFLDELGFNASAVMQRIGNTRALDGTLEAAADDYVATWTYHPDDGLSMVIERQ